MTLAAMDEGERACRAGKPTSDNPYREGSDERFGWLLGWVGARPRTRQLGDQWAGALSFQGCGETARMAGPDDAEGGPPATAPRS
jgi:hypothetical protein